MDEYSRLQEFFDRSLSQASKGKGKERHARDDEKFEEQLMCAAQRILVDHPCGGLAYQVIKKTVESGRLLKERGIEAARAELSGAANYLGGMDIIYSEQEEDPSIRLSFKDSVVFADLMFDPGPPTDKSKEAAEKYKCRCGECHDKCSKSSL
jgi:hypothetical protein